MTPASRSNTLVRRQPVPDTNAPSLHKTASAYDAKRAAIRHFVHSGLNEEDQSRISVLSLPSTRTPCSSRQKSDERREGRVEIVGSTRV